MSAELPTVGQVVMMSHRGTRTKHVVTSVIPLGELAQQHGQVALVSLRRNKPKARAVRLAMAFTDGSMRWM